MVQQQALNFSSIIDEFFSLKPLGGAHAAALRRLVDERAREILAHPDVRYMPAFKILDLLAGIVNDAAAIDAEPQLRAPEAAAMLRNLLSDSSTRLRQFMLEAALERARYEPMIVAVDNGGEPLRDATLHKRWAAMLEAHQHWAALPQPWIEVVGDAVERVIGAPCFSTYRHGPLMQYFAEMLATARQLHAQKAPLESLAVALREDGALWKRYALKPRRYKQSPPVLAELPLPPTIH